VFEDDEGTFCYKTMKVSRDVVLPVTGSFSHVSTKWLQASQVV